MRACVARGWEGRLAVGWQHADANVESGRRDGWNVEGFCVSERQRWALIVRVLVGGTASSLIRNLSHVPGAALIIVRRP